MAESCDKIVLNGANVSLDNRNVEFSDNIKENKTDEGSNFVDDPIAKFESEVSNLQVVVSLIRDISNLKSECENILVIQGYFLKFIKKGAMDRMLLEDYKTNNLPVSLENILKYCDATKIYLHRADYVAIFVYISMLEMGFVTTDCNIESDPYYEGFNYDTLLSQTQYLPTNWNEPDCYKFTFKLPGFPLNHCKLTCLKVADDILINASMVNSPNNNTSMLVDPKLYVLDTRKERLWFQDLKKLSTLIKSQIGFPVKVAILRTKDPSFTVFNLLPLEVVLHILDYCDQVDFQKLQAVLTR